MSELADRIKALKAANTIEAAPQRVQRKQAAAEEPITARIRRRQEVNSEAHETVQPADARAAEAANDNHRADNDNQPRNSSVKPLTFQERIALERQRGPSSRPEPHPLPSLCCREDANRSLESLFRVFRLLRVFRQRGRILLSRD